MLLGLTDYVGLPATFKGSIPCPDCDRVDIVLNLRPDSLYQLRKIYQLGSEAIKIDAQMGRWRFTPEDRLLILGKEKGRLKTYLVVDNNTLRFVEWEGTDNRSQIQYDLIRAAEVDPFSDVVKMRGMFVEREGKARFTECSSGVSFNVLKGGDYQTTAQNYMNTPHDADVPLLVSIMGSIRHAETLKNSAGTLLIDQFRRFYPNRDCEGNMIRASFTGTYWLLDELDGVVVEQQIPADDALYLTFDPDRTLYGYGGCNRISGTYLIKGDVFLFKRTLGTRLACDRGMERENRLLRILDETETYRLEDDTLQLLDQNEMVRAQFVAGP